MSDVTVVFDVEDRTNKISAHKIVLAQSSGFFRKAFNGNFRVYQSISLIREESVLMPHPRKPYPPKSHSAMTIRMLC